MRRTCWSKKSFNPSYVAWNLWGQDEGQIVENIDRWEDRTSARPEEKTKSFAIEDKTLLVEEDIEDLVATIDVEIKEIEKSIMDLRKKVGFD